MQRHLGATQPRYRQLAQTLINEIRSGKFRVGSHLPTELELSEQFGASRHTVREALRQLAQMGMVSRQPGVGTRVEARSAAPAYRQVMSGFRDLHKYTSDTTLEILERTTAEPPADMAESIGALAGETWLYLQGVRVAKGSVPICATQIYIHPTFRSLALKRSQNVPIYTLIEEQFGERITRVRQDIAAVALDSRTAKSLKARRGSPGLLIVRRYVNARRQTVEVALNVHPAQRFSYSEEFEYDWIAAKIDR